MVGIIALLVEKASRSNAVSGKISTVRDRAAKSGGVKSRRSCSRQNG